MTEMQQQIIQWLASGETGISSETMAFVIGFDVVPRRAGYPRDPADLNRCVLLLYKAPEMRKYLYKMKAISPVWTKLVENWDKLESLFLQEKARGDSAPKTYQLMKTLTADSSEIRFGHMAIKRY